MGRQRRRGDALGQSCASTSLAWPYAARAGVELSLLAEQSRREPRRSSPWHSGSDPTIGGFPSILPNVPGTDLRDGSISMPGSWAAAAERCGGRAFVLDGERWLLGSQSFLGVPSQVLSAAARGECQ